VGIISNAKWVTASQVVRVSTQVLGVMILARLLSPTEYGLMAMALVVMNFAMIFKDLGTSAAIIQKAELSEQTKTATFWFNLALGIAIAVAVLALAPALSQLFRQQKLTPVLSVLAFVFPLSSAGAVHQALLERESKFSAVARVEIFSSTAGLLVAIVLAMLGAGVYSLVLQVFTSSVLTSILLWTASGWRPNGIRSFTREQLKPIVGFGSNLAGFNTINYFSRNADGLIIGHFMTAAILGAYSLAYRIMLFPLQSMTFVASRSLYPILSKRQNSPADILPTYLKLIRVVACLVAPMMAGMVVVRKDFITIFIGEGWDLSADILLWLAPTGFLQSIVSTTGLIFMSTGRVKLLLRISIFNAVTQVGSFLIGSQHDIVTLSALYLVANVVNFVPNMMLCMKAIEGGISQIFSGILPSVFCAIAMALFVQLVCKAGLSELSVTTRFAVAIACGVLSYLSLIRLVSPTTFALVTGLLRRGKK